MANELLLATMQYITSCWIFSGSCINQIQLLIMSYLWCGEDGRLANTRVAWPNITLPVLQGRWGIGGPTCGIPVLLGKFIVCELLSGFEP